MTGLPLKPPSPQPEQLRGWVTMSHRDADLSRPCIGRYNRRAGSYRPAGPGRLMRNPGGDPRWSNPSRPRRETREHYQADMVGGAVEQHRTTDREPTR